MSGVADGSMLVMASGRHVGGVWHRVMVIVRSWRDWAHSGTPTTSTLPRYCPNSGLRRHRTAAKRRDDVASTALGQLSAKDLKPADGWSLRGASISRDCS